MYCNTSRKRKCCDDIINDKVNGLNNFLCITIKNEEDDCTNTCETENLCDKTTPLLTKCPVLNDNKICEPCPTCPIPTAPTNQQSPIPTTPTNQQSPIPEYPLSSINWLGSLQKISTTLRHKSSSGGGGSNPPPTIPTFTPAHSSAGLPGQQGLIDLGNKALLTPYFTDHSPDGAGVTPTNYQDTFWDGTPYNPCGKTRFELCSWLFPYRSVPGGPVYLMRGLTQLYNDKQPFADPLHPTPAEIDKWNHEILLLFRRLFGITTPLTQNKCLFLRAQWASEKKWTTYWDQPKYLSQFPSCVGNPDPHCGYLFVPDDTDQAPYLNGDPPCPSLSHAEGIGTSFKGQSWFTILAGFISSYVCNDGITGHTYQLTKGLEYGLNFYENPDPGGFIEIRMKTMGDGPDPCPPP